MSVAAPPGAEHAREICILVALHRSHIMWTEGATMDVVHPRCCGLDVHKKSVVACVLITHPDGSLERQMRTFKTITADLLKLADWLSNLQVTHVSMESTGVYWRPSSMCWRMTSGRSC